jgi:AraC-like DNA-binding protein
MDLYHRIVRAKLFIDQHYDSPLNLNRLSDEACFSKFHFIRLFKKAYNRTPHQYLVQRRLEKAKERLIHDNVRIADVCTAVGFESTTSFSLMFRAHTGETPALFRLRAMQKQKLQREEPEKVIPFCMASMFSPRN